ncbi:hypothetical protein BDB00DRAFT_818740 [Zychaea mexicana]|uniref:uncharacterized protein n=1 Tax=Zychaea mexicana TaxID=64656 RepID=UPI0022FF258C|nr:uncharacterized protein BDB00DRAFT_818740 [Zychaea mexicana]KAI9494327.1 hypothetical protein BDB00DRAFT_818740 [Zychaea mexicana]
MPNSSLSTYTTMMRVTKNGRPYCQDLNDLFAALVIQHGLRDHRYRFRTIPASFVFLEAIEVLGHLQFTHVMKTADPADPSRLIATRTTTTFTMSPNMARTLGQYFCTSRLLENAIDPVNHSLKDKVIYILSPKGKYVIEDFSQRAQVPIKQMEKALSSVDSFNIVTLERLPQHDDQLAFARPNMTLAFKTMMAYLPMESLLADDAGGIDKKNLDDFRYAFYGYQAFEWISEYTTVVTREEAEMVAAEFVLYGWIAQVLDKSDRDNSIRDESVVFKMGRGTVYHVTSRGRSVLGWDKPLDKELRGTVTDNQDIVIMKQRGLAARLKHIEKPATVPTAIPSSKKNKQAPASTNTDAASSPSSAASTAPSTASSTYSAESQNPSSSDDSSTEIIPNALEGTEGLEFAMPVGKAKLEQGHDTLQASQTATDIDEVTERLLQLRSTGSESPSRPSSAIFNNDTTHHHHHTETDFITSAPLDGSVPLDPNSHWAKLRQILEDSLIRMYFRDFMKSQFCEENVKIWVDYYNIRKKCKRGNVSTKELLRDAYAMYDNYLAPDATLEVNIDHGLRQEIISYVTNNFTIYSGDDHQHQYHHHHRHHHTHGSSHQVPFVATAFQPNQQQVTVVVNGHTNECLRALLRLYDRVNEHICRIMAQDSVPKFIKTDKYRELVAHPPAPVRRNSIEQRYPYKPSSASGE